jgi:methionine sulfoxide reductase heme-binding subunit
MLQDTRRSVLLRVLSSPYAFWALLALPSVGMIEGLVSGGASAERLLHPTGEFAARFMILAMMITPLRMLFAARHWPDRWLLWLMRRRRALGVAAFAYAAAHTVLYIVDMGSLQLMLDAFFALGIWTGWAAFAIFLPLALTSNNPAQRLLRSWWKPLQRWVYAAAMLTLVHWIFVHNNLGAALAHFVPLALLESYRIWKTHLAGRVFPSTA